jgi:hypothetical protein
MNKHLRNTIVLGTLMLLLAACAAPTAQPTATIPPTPVITSTPIIIVVTATPEPATFTPTAQPTDTEVPTATNTEAPKITYTPTVAGAYNADGAAITSDKSIIITGIQDKGTGSALLSWKANGTFSSGFRIYYSYYIKMPSIGSEKFEYAIPDGATRSAYVSGEPGTTYYYRICSYTGSSCEFYSNLFTYTFPGATSTPQ